jgi:hypothetical protein
MNVLDVCLRQRRFQRPLLALEFLEFACFVSHMNMNNSVEQMSFAILAQPDVNRLRSANIVQSSGLTDRELPLFNLADYFLAECLAIAPFPP